MFLLRLLLIPRSPETLTHVHTVPLLLGSTTTQRSVRRNSVWQRPLWIWPSKLGACLPSGQKPAQEAFRTPHAAFQGSFGKPSNARISSGAG